jgi:hypothetical protein
MQVHKIPQSSFLSSRPIWDPTPSHAGECVSPSPLGSGGKTHSLDGEGWGGGGGPSSNGGQILCYSVGIYVLCTKKASLWQGAQVPHRPGRLQHEWWGAHSYHEGGWVAGFWIRIQHFFQLLIRIWIQFQIQGFDYQIWEKIYSFFDKKNSNLLIPRPP